MSLRGTARATADGGGSRWPIGPRQPHLPSGSADVWWADLAMVGDEVVGLLSSDEAERAAGVVDERRRIAWSRSRGVLRVLLGRYLQCDATTVELARGAQDKPSLAGRTPPQPLCFNLAHLGDVALYAFSASGPVGVDVQVLRDGRPRKSVDHVALARRAFGEHEAQRLNLVEPQRREWEFLRAWTRHEAELKRRGTGIGGGEPPADSTAPCTVELDVGERATAAIALSDRAIELRRWSFL